MPVEETAWKLKKAGLGRVYENLDLARLKQWVLEARVEETDEVLPPGRTEWVAAAALPELLPYFRPDAQGSEVLSGEDVEISFRRQGSSGEADDTELDMTPIIDVTFNLIIFLVITAQFTQRGLVVDRPETPIGSTFRKEHVSVQVDREGRIFFEGKEVTLSMLRRNLSTRLKASGQTTVTIDADKDARHGVVAQVIAACQMAGARKFNIPTHVRPEIP